jgi:hypothetical protein
MSIDRGTAVGAGITGVGATAGFVGFHQLRGVLADAHDFQTPKALAALSEQAAKMPPTLESPGNLVKLLNPKKTYEALQYGTQTAHMASAAGAAAQADAGKLALLEPRAIKGGVILGAGALLAAVGAGVLLSSLLD